MQFTAILLNFTYAVLGGIITLIFMFVGYKIFDHQTHFDTSQALAEGNRAVGTVVMGIFVGVGVAVGLVIGLGLN